jgi:ubiquitin-like protein Pup
MANQQQLSKQDVKRDEAAPAEVTASPAVQEKGEKLKSEMDALLDEIDGVLEANADQFVKSYVQKGGQ